MPIGQEAGVTSSASDCSISSNGSRPSRSSLLTKVMIGTSRQPADLEELAGLLLEKDCRTQLFLGEAGAAQTNVCGNFAERHVLRVGGEGREAGTQTGH